MTFMTAWLAAAGLIAVSVPIIIHLLSRQRKRPVEWAAMRYLLEAFRKQKRRLQVEQLLLLIVRCLILAVLGFALARPVLQAAGLLSDGSSRAVVIVIDNGIISGVQTDAGETALEAHLNQARIVIEALGESDTVGLVTTARPARTLVMPPTLDHSAVLRQLNEITTSEAASDLPGALRDVAMHAEDLQADGRQVVTYLFSEFRQGSARIDTPMSRLFPEEAGSFALLASPPADSTASNVQIVDIEPVRRLVLPGATDGSQQITVRLARHGGELGRQTSRVRIEGDGISAQPARTVEWSQGQDTASVNFLLDFGLTVGQPIGVRAIVDDADALGADNRRYVTLDVRDSVRIAMIDQATFGRIGLIDQLGPGPWIRMALRPSETAAMDVVDVDPGSLDDIDLRTVDAAIVPRPDRLTIDGWRALRRFIERGGLVIIVPPSEATVHPWTDRLPDELGLPWRIALEVEHHDDGLTMATEQPNSELFRLLGPELDALVRPVVAFRTLPIVVEETQADRLLEFADGRPMMIAGSPRLLRERDSGDDQVDDTAPGMVIYLAVTPELRQWTNLPSQPMMVPLFQESIRQGLNLIRAQLRMSAGEQTTLVGIPGVATDLRSPRGTRIELGENRRPRQPLSEAGVYDVLDAAGRSVALLAVNIEPGAAVTETQAESAVANWLAESGEWRYFDRTNPAAPLAVGSGGTPLAGSLLMTLLVLVLVETMLARRFSHAYQVDTASGMEGGLKPTMVDLRTTLRGTASG